MNESNLIKDVGVAYDDEVFTIYGRNDTGESEVRMERKDAADLLKRLKLSLIYSKDVPDTN